jgi:hypothetical protein
MWPVFFANSKQSTKNAKFARVEAASRKSSFPPPPRLHGQTLHVQPFFALIRITPSRWKIGIGESSKAH